LVAQSKHSYSINTRLYRFTDSIILYKRSGRKFKIIIIRKECAQLLPYYKTEITDM
jgi:hypothetical protein